MMVEIESNELEALRANAARWSFLRQFSGTDEFPIEENPVSPEHADVLVDAAIIKAKVKND
jgi:hypothetical protein